MKRIFAFVLLVSSGCILPFALPPAKIDASGGAEIAAPAPSQAFHLNAGLSLNSAQIDEQAPFDVQAGYALHINNGLAAHGVYGSFDWFSVSPRSTARATIGGRGEALINPNGSTSLNTFLRFGGELYTPSQGPFSGASNDAFIFGGARGTSGISAFLDMGRLQEIGGDASTYIGLGFGVRIPAVVGILIGIPTNW